VSETLKVGTIPQNWIVDANGVVRLKRDDYDAITEWEAKVKEAIEKYTPGAGTPAAAPGSR